MSLYAASGPFFTALSRAVLRGFLRMLPPFLIFSSILVVLPAVAAGVRPVRRIPLPASGHTDATRDRVAVRADRGGSRVPRPGRLPFDPTGKPAARLLSTEAVGLLLDSTYYDYQGHGVLPARIAAIGDSALHILPYVGEDPALTVRGPKYIYYAAGGATNYGYVGGGGEARGGFGSVAGSVRPGSGAGNVAVAAIPVDLPDSIDLNWHAFVDASQGAGAFTPFTVDPGPEIDPCDRIRYPSIWARGDASGTMAMAAMTLCDCSGGFPDIVVTRADDVSGGWAPVQVLDTLEDPAAWNAGPEPPILAGADDGGVGVVTTDFGTNVYLWESTDGGATWGPRENITGYPATPHLVPPDSTSTEYRPLQGAALAYDEAGSPHIVWTEYQARGNASDSIYTPGVDPLWPYRTRLMHWSPETGVTTIYRNPSGLADAAHGTAYAYNVGHPAIGFMAGGGYVYVVFEGFVDADLDPANGLGYGDIYASLSSDGGESWGSRVNVTDSPGIDDLYPSIPRLNPSGAFSELPWLQPEGSDDVVDFPLLYQSDGIAGTNVQGDEPVPAIDHLLLAAVDVYPLIAAIGDRSAAPPGIPRAFSLAPNAPNPFNPATTITYTLREPARVALRIYDLRGRRVRTLVEGEREAGTHEAAWDGRDDRGGQSSGGVYLCRMEADGRVRAVRKMVLLK